MRGRDEYIFDLNHFESVAQHLADNPSDATKVMLLRCDLSCVTSCVMHVFCNKICLQEELSLLPRLPPEDFFSWASEISGIEGNPTALPSVSEVVRNRGISNRDAPGASQSTQTDWSLNKGGQVSAPADKVLHECRQAHGGQAIWTAYECEPVEILFAFVFPSCQTVSGMLLLLLYRNGSDVGDTLSQNCETLAVDAMLEGNVARSVNADPICLGEWCS